MTGSPCPAVSGCRCIDDGAAATAGLLAPQSSRREEVTKMADRDTSAKSTDEKKPKITIKRLEQSKPRPIQANN